MHTDAKMPLFAPATRSLEFSFIVLLCRQSVRKLNFQSMLCGPICKEISINHRVENRRVTGQVAPKRRRRGAGPGQPETAASADLCIGFSSDSWMAMYDDAIAEGFDDSANRDPVTRGWMTDTPRRGLDC